MHVQVCPKWRGFSHGIYHETSSKEHHHPVANVLLQYRRQQERTLPPLMLTVYTFLSCFQHGQISASKLVPVLYGWVTDFKSYKAWSTLFCIVTVNFCIIGIYLPVHT